MKLGRLRKIAVQNRLPIAYGSICEIYQASLVDPVEKSRKIALKVLTNKSSFQEFVSEWKEMSQISSKYVPRYYEFGQFRGKPALVMEYVEGVTFYELVCRKVLSPRLLEFVFDSIELALKELHELCRIHGDLSPKNIMINTSGAIKLIDFGLSSRTREISRGTPGFLSMEDLERGKRTFSGDWEAYEALKIWAQNMLESGSQTIDEPGPGVCTDSEVSQQLSSIVSKIRCEQIETQAMGSKVSRATIKTRFIPFILLISFLSGIPWPVMRSSGLEKLTGEVSIRTQDWVQISLNGNRDVYAPIDFQMSPGHYLMKWKTLYKSGEVVLTVEAGQRIFLSDEDFQGRASGNNRIDSPGTYSGTN